MKSLPSFPWRFNPIYNHIRLRTDLKTLKTWNSLGFEWGAWKNLEIGAYFLIKPGSLKYVCVRVRVCAPFIHVKYLKILSIDFKFLLIVCHHWSWYRATLP